MARRRRHSREFKLAALARMEGTSDVAGLAAELGIDRNLLYKWNRAFQAGGAEGLRLPGERLGVRGAAGTTELERKVAQQALELDFFRAALQHFAGSCPKSGGSGGMGSTS